MTIAPQSFRDSVSCGCFQMFGIFAMLIMLGKCAQWME